MLLLLSIPPNGLQLIGPTIDKLGWVIPKDT
jgi:hypothetical protein